jgi:amidophosphoribosyltransferase
MCGIFGISGHKEAGWLSYLGLYALQHRGEESAGIVVRDGNKINIHKGMGLVCDVFNENSIKNLKGDTAVGHVRYSTTGSSCVENAQPFCAYHKKINITVAHNGNLTNIAALRQQMEDKGSIFQTSMDSEIIAHLIAAGCRRNIEENIIATMKSVEGAYSLVLMIDDMLVGARDPYGFRPLCLGKFEGAYVLASETSALDLVRAEYVRDIEPGEIVFIRKDKIDSVKPFCENRKAHCIFEYIYFSRPDSNIFGNNVYLCRKRLGENLVSECKLDCDIVMPVPDSGSYAAIGFSEKSKIPFEMGMIRNHYIGRTFIQPFQSVRDFKVRIKLNPIRDALRGKRLAIIEDSIVRGTTTRARVKTLKETGAKELHMCVTCPPIRFPCFYGIDFPTKKELIASEHTVEWIRDFLGLDSLTYLSLEGMLNAMPLPSQDFCAACFTGQYPEKPPKKLSKEILEP